MVDMIDLDRLESYRENNRIEAKKSLGGLPHSLWETYSSFANTFGGVILLGVEEKKDKSFLVHNLPDPEALVGEFWNIVSDKRYVSENILQKDQVQILMFHGKQIVAIFVPKADRRKRPVYIGTDAYTGSYRRDGEGDYHCSRKEVDEMLWEAGQEEEDTVLLTDHTLRSLDMETVKRYRSRMEKERPGHIWLKLKTELFLEKLGAVGRDEKGELHPTAAGLLMFGREREILQEYPCYALFYQEMGKNGIWENIIASDTGDFSCNLFEFYSRTYQRICRKIRIPASFAGKYPGAETPIHNAMKELLVNCLVHADYREKQGVMVMKAGSRITFENPGCLGVDREAALTGCLASPRHPLLIQMFHLINVGNGAGRGISQIYSLWKESGFVLPSIKEQNQPGRTQISISVGRKRAPAAAGSKFKKGKEADGGTAFGAAGRELRQKRRDSAQVIYESRRQQVIDYITVNQEVRTAELTKLLDIELPKVKQLLARMVEEDILETSGGMGNLTYRLKQ